MLKCRSYEPCEEDMLQFCMLAEDCLSEADAAKLKENWQAAGGRAEVPWWKYIQDHCSITIN